MCTFGSIRLSFLVWIVFASLASARPSSDSGIWHKVHHHQELSNNSILSEKNSRKIHHLLSNSSYMSNLKLEKSLKDFARECHNISRLYSIGKSSMGFPLWVLEISDKPGGMEAEPAFKYIGNMHGDEPVGREILLMLANWLCINYLKDSLATFIVQNAHLHLLPSMNPDGFSLSRRTNGNGIDLNRDFPDQFFPQNNNEKLRQPETKAVMDWTRRNRFVASASLHGGALVANYAWDGTSDGRQRYSTCPDDSAFRYLATIYSQFHANMSHSENFHGGITNGAAWYPIYGGMQDWNYINGECLELTLEISNRKIPPPIEVLKIWEENRLSMLQLISSVVKSGVHGRVISSWNAKPLHAIISVKGILHNVTADDRLGHYHRILSPGSNYEVTATAPGFLSSTARVSVSEGKSTRLDFILNPKSHEHNERNVQPQLQGVNLIVDKAKVAEVVSNVKLADAIDSSGSVKDTWQIHNIHQETRVGHPVAIVRDARQQAINSNSSKKGTVIARKQLRASYDGDLITDIVAQHVKASSFCIMIGVVLLCTYALFRWINTSKPHKLPQLRKL
eukprot:c29265_g2_i5 orf=101-1795(-)